MAETKELAVQSHEGQISVRCTHFGQEAETQEVIAVRPFVTHPARVRISRGRTINLGNYESARVDATVEIPCYREEVVQVYRQLSPMVEGLLDEEVARIAKAHGLSIATDSTPSIEEVL